MSFRVTGTILLTLVFSFYAAAQHGEAEGGFYNFNYHGDIWTGEMTAFDQAAGTITLTYEHRGKVETFAGVIKPPVQVIDKSGNRSPAQVHLKVGDRITVYYIKEGLKYSTKEGGKEHTEVANSNLIFQIKLLDPRKH
jgi:hypothetical protein